MRSLVVLLGGVAVLALVNYSICEKEQLLANGRVVLLELVPVDPRSIMQGDFMALRFGVQSAVSPGGLRDGQMVMALDDRNVATFRRLDNGTPLAPDEIRIYYRVRANQVRLGTNAFFFQEGDASCYRGARYGEARVGSDGAMLLTGLRDGNLRKMGPAASRRGE